MFILAEANPDFVARGMTTQEKTSAITKLLSNHQDNVNAVNAAAVKPGLTDLVIEAMNESLKMDLDSVFAGTERSN